MPYLVKSYQPSALFRGSLSVIPIHSPFNRQKVNGHKCGGTRFCLRRKFDAQFHEVKPSGIQHKSSPHALSYTITQIKDHLLCSSTTPQMRLESHSAFRHILDIVYQCDVFFF